MNFTEVFEKYNTINQLRTLIKERISKIKFFDQLVSSGNF
jgi:hypothetical protein